MTDPAKSTHGLSKKPGLVWIVVAIAIVLALGIALYMVWRRAGSTGLEVKASEGTLNKARLEITELQGSVKSRDEKITELQQRITEQDTKIIKLQYDIEGIRREIGTSTRAPSRRQTRRIPCTGDSCEMNSGSTVDVDDI